MLYLSIVLVGLWYLFIELRLKYYRLKQQIKNNNKFIELLEKAFDNHMDYIYIQLHKLEEAKKLYQLRRNK